MISIRCVAILALVAGCTSPAPGPGLDVPQVMDHAVALTAIGPRPGDSDASRAAAAYIERTLVAEGAKVERFPVGAVDLPAIALMGRTFRPARRAETSDPNLVVRLGPPGRALLVMAHYDTVRESPGAVDDAASVAIAMELVHVLTAAPPGVPVIVAFTANEEIGLVGAEALAARIGDEVSFAIALDLVGGSGDLTLNGASELIGADEMMWLAGMAENAGVTIRAPLAHRVVSRWWPQAERADHGAFTRRGIRAVHLYHRGQDGEWIDLAYHSARDDLGRIDRGSVDEVGRLLVALTRGLPPEVGGGDGFWLPILRNRIMPRWVLLAIEGVLVALALVSLVTLRTARARGGAGFLVGAACFALAGGATYALEVLTRGDHPSPWVHAPLRFVIAELLVLVGALGLVTLVVRRVRGFVGELRYLVACTLFLLAAGVALVAIGAAELAWIWLVPAAITALVPHVPRARWLAPVAAALPLVLVLAPNQLREVAYHGFLPSQVPLAVLVSVFSLPVAAALAWVFRSRGTTGPLGAFVLPMGCLLSVVAGVLLVSRAHPPCTGDDFNQFRLACEQVRGVR